LPVDKVPKQRYSQTKPALPLADLRKRSSVRLAKDPYFRALDTLLKAQESKRALKSMRLDRARYFSDRREARRQSEGLEKLRTHQELKAHALASLTATQDSLEIDKEKRWEEQLGKDAYLGEAYSIVRDLLTVKK
jgi:hypothetical protein